MGKHIRRAWRGRQGLTGAQDQVVKCRQQQVAHLFLLGSGNSDAGAHPSRQTRRLGTRWGVLGARGSFTEWKRGGLGVVAGPWAPGDGSCVKA